MTKGGCTTGIGPMVLPAPRDVAPRQIIGKRLKVGKVFYCFRLKLCDPSRHEGPEGIHNASFGYRATAVGQGGFHLDRRSRPARSLRRKYV